MADFQYNNNIQNSSEIKAYIDKPILDWRNKGVKIINANQLDCGSFTNFGYLNSYTDFNKSIEYFLNALDSYFNDLNSRINALYQIVK